MSSLKLKNNSKKSAIAYSKINLSSMYPDTAKFTFYIKKKQKKPGYWHMMLVDASQMLLFTFPSHFMHQHKAKQPIQYRARRQQIRDKF